MNTLRSTTTVVSFALLAAALAGSSGCGMTAKDWKPSKLFSLDNAWPWGDDEPEEGMPVRVVGAWTDTVLTQSGQKPQRGFGGRLMFYGGKDEKPILVDGQLVVYAFEEKGRDPTDNKPTRRYVFPPDQIPLHMSNSDVGATYSFWLPWDEAGGPKTEVSLICRFEPKDGAVVTSEQTRHLLPGAMSLETAVTGRSGPKLPEGVASRPARPTLESLRSHQTTNNGTQLASFESAADSQPDANPADSTATLPARQMTVTSITLPDNFQLRDAAAYARPVAPTVSPASQPMPPMQQALPFQPQQPAAIAQPVNQSMQAPLVNGAYAVPQLPASQNRLGAVPFANQLNSPTISTPAMYAPPINGFGTAIPTRPQLVAPQTMTRPVATPIATPSVPGAVAAAGQVILPVQQQATPPTLQQQAWPQMPAPSSSVQTTVSYPSRAASQLRPGG